MRSSAVSNSSQKTMLRLAMTTQVTMYATGSAAMSSQRYLQIRNDAGDSEGVVSAAAEHGEAEFKGRNAARRTVAVNVSVQPARPGSFSFLFLFIFLPLHRLR